MKKPERFWRNCKELSAYLIMAIFLLSLFAGCKKELESSHRQPPPPPPPPPVEKPNIILILTDDIGYEVPTCDGGESYQTPNLDRMAEQGMRFTECHATPLCSPSRFMLATGKYNFRNYTQWGIMDVGQKTIANMLKDAGYKTYVAGKWQFGGGDASIHTFGYDKYIVYNAFTPTSSGDEGSGSRYKNPKLYVNGGYLPDSLTLNKYGDDIILDSIISYLDSNAHDKTPFFVYYPMMLSHPPFSPTPDDPEFATWDPGLHLSDSVFFPSMVKYMDKLIGKLFDKVNSLGIANKTIILLTSDNGTPGPITSKYNGRNIRGAKGKTTEYGTNVPLLVNFRGTIDAGSVNNDLIDFTDFFPTFADLANVSNPDIYGPLDGVSFYPRIINQPGTPREWIFLHYAPHPDEGDIPTRYVQNIQYKYYEDNRFYDLLLDIQELNPIPGSSLTSEEKQAKKNFEDVLSEMH